MARSEDSRLPTPPHGFSHALWAAWARLAGGFICGAFAEVKALYRHQALQDRDDGEVSAADVARYAAVKGDLLSSRIRHRVGRRVDVKILDGNGRVAETD